MAYNYEELNLDIMRECKEGYDCLDRFKAICGMDELDIEKSAAEGNFDILEQAAKSIMTFIMTSKEWDPTKNDQIIKDAREFKTEYETLLEAQSSIEYHIDVNHADYLRCISIDDHLQTRISEISARDPDAAQQFNDSVAESEDNEDLTVSNMEATADENHVFNMLKCIKSYNLAIKRLKKSIEFLHTAHETPTFLGMLITFVNQFDSQENTEPSIAVSHCSASHFYHGRRKSLDDKPEIMTKPLFERRASV